LAFLDLGAMPAITTKDLETLLDAKEYRLVVVKKIHGRYYLIVYDLDNRPLIHCNKGGRQKEYRHVEQPLEWLERKFGITNVAVE
jgi:hypothetical protein